MEAVKKYGILTVGSVILGISDYMFKFQNHFSFGGVSGIAVIMSGLLGGSASTYTFVINMLLLVVAFAPQFSLTWTRPAEDRILLLWY